jgi:uncharacterized protein (TIGR01440 family)
MHNNLNEQAFCAVAELIEKAKLKKGDILVVGCSTSEVLGDTIGSNSAPEAAKALFEGILKATKEKGVYIAAQCCEHLNRAIVIERDAAKLCEAVNVVPAIKAGGSFATTAYSRFENPVVVEEIKADAGIDIGQTLIGMHLKRVAVPVRLSVKTIGEAVITAARTRPKFIGGCRAVYNEELL